jgi:hypothetical protein
LREPARPLKRREPAEDLFLRRAPGGQADVSA